MQPISVMRQYADFDGQNGKSWYITMFAIYNEKRTRNDYYDLTLHDS